MTATVNLTPEEIAEIQTLTQQKDVGEAIRAAMREYVRYARRQELKSLSGKVEFQDNWQVLEEAELKADNEARKPRTD
jgi:hypothetical protein